METKSKELGLMDQAPLEEFNDHEPVESPRASVLDTRKRLARLEWTLKEVEGHSAARGTFRESKKPKKYSSYEAMMCKFIESKPSMYEESVEEQVWKDPMT